jgi:UDP:flavonoid glycosyltransferase YjiC (YdhE family)
VVRILVSWELGGGLGHVTRLAPIAKRLLHDGHQIVAAVRDPMLCYPHFQNAEIIVIAAPCEQVIKPVVLTPLTHADTLANCGFAETSRLEALVNGWLSLFNAYHVEAIVADHSPTALLAAAIADLPAIAIGTGFEVPPNVTPFPNLRRRIDVGPRQIEQDEIRILDRVNRVAKRQGGGSIASLATLYHRTPPVLLTYPELDPYGARADESYFGALTPNWGESPTWPSGEGPRVFAYLINHSFSATVLQAIAELTSPVIAVLDQNLAKATIEVRNPHVRIERRLMNAKLVAADSDLSICFGQHGSIVAALRGGKPLLMAPWYLEQLLHSERVASIGAGVVCSLHKPGDFATTLHNAIASLGSAEATLAKNAAKFAADYPDDDSQLLERIGHRIRLALSD